MIAPLQQTERRRAARGPRWHRARRAVADALLRPDVKPAPTPEAVPAWQAWCLAGWVAVTTLVYLWFMVRGG